jgi:hypothetical protein
MAVAFVVCQHSRSWKISWKGFAVRKVFEIRLYLETISIS